MMASDHTRASDEKLSTIDLQAVNGGTLVFEDKPDELGRRLIGFADVDDWSAVRDELAQRGLGVGSIHQKEVFEPREVGL